MHPDTQHAAAYIQGHQPAYTGKGRLRRETAAILGAWQPAYVMLTLLRLGPYTHIWLASRDANASTPSWRTGQPPASPASRLLRTARRST
ncbi:hypothetical protein [Streptomyces sp. NPDC101150]|uniref:hypothetical protein n=1 Tax=Streptomyces sp. NPDC101150 TaxID=3366114 RepID=UPI0037F31AA9